MTINKCDICKKTIETTDENTVGIYLRGDRLQKFELCPKCTEPVMKFLKAKKLIKQDKK